MHPSDKPGILFLKLPATMLQTSPSASEKCCPTFSTGKPSILELIKAAVLSWQRTVITPHNCPASPTIEVTFMLDSSMIEAGVSLQDKMSSKTSRVSSSRKGMHF